MSDAAPGAEAQRAEARPFEAEVSRLLHLMVHSVYSNRDVFLRELVSNAADAVEKLRTLALDNPALVAGDADYRITLSADPKARLLTVEDNGVGMDHDELVDNLGTIARSGTRAFLEQGNAGDGSALIGQFGVGFYSAFMVADRVDVVSRKVGAEEAWRWSSDGHGSFTVTPAPADDAPARGTRVILHLNEAAKEYAEAATIERVVGEYSAHVPVPIELVLPGGEAKRRIADGSALWRKPKSAVEPRDYSEFYSHVSGQFDEPALTLHYRAEGRHEYSVLVFVPSMKPFDLFDPERKGRIRLYVRRVFITGDASILPAWLRFVRGVIDSEDLPLNLSREMLQTNPILEQIGKGVTSRLLTELERLARDEPDKFRMIWEAFGPVIKEGLYEEPERRDALFRIARFRTSTSGEDWRALSDYVGALRPNQTSIYYALGENRDAILASPHLEGFRRRGVEVLLLSDPVDAFWVRSAVGFEGKSFKSITQGDAGLDAIPVEAGNEPEGEPAEAPKASVAVLAARFREVLGDRVGDVRASTRLADSPVCLVASDLGPDLQLDRLLARSGQTMGGRRSAPVLELNPAHGLIRALAERAATGADKSLVDDAAVLLYGQARILDGETPENPADFAGRIGRLLEARLN